MADVPPPSWTPEPHDPSPYAQAPVPPAEPPARKVTAKAWVGIAGAAAVLGLIGGVVLTRTDGTGTTASAAAVGGTRSGAAGQGQGALPGGMGTRGTIASIDGSTITLTADLSDPGGTSSGSASTSTVTVTTSSDTVVTETVAGTASDIAVGDTVRVEGTTSGTEIAAVEVHDLGTEDLSALAGGGGGGTPPSDGDMPAGMTPPDGMTAPDGTSGGQSGPGGGMGTVGTVTARSGSTLTVEGTDGGTYTVTLADDTSVVVARTITLSDLAVGDAITVTGTTSDGTVAATAIRVGDLGGPPQG